MRRPARIAGRADLVRFLRALGLPTRASALRGAIDSVTVTRALDRSGLRPLMRSRGGGARDLHRARAVAEAVDAGMGLLPLAPTCLRRSVTLLREMDRLGLEGALHIGVRTIDGTVEAHAWVQVGDEVVNDDPAEIATYGELAVGELGRLLPFLR